MASIYLLIPLAVILLFLAIALFFWAVNNKQYDDLDSPSQQILIDDKLDRIRQEEQRASIEKEGHKEKTGS